MNVARMRIWIWVLAFVMVMACGISVWLAAPPAAEAAPDYRIVLYDGSVECAEDASKNLYCYAYNSSERMYTFVYHAGIDLRLGDTTTTGEAVTWSGVAPMREVKRDNNGSLYYYSVLGNIAGTNYTFRIRIEPREVGTTWISDTMQCEYGQTVRPEVELDEAVPDAVSFEATDGSTFDTQYVKGIGCGQYTVRAVLPTYSNYVLTGNTSVYTVDTYKGSIEVDATEATLQYSGDSVNAVAVLGARNADGYPFHAEYSIDNGVSWTQVESLAAAKRYLVRYAFEGKPSNYAHPKTDDYVVTIEKGDASLRALESVVTVGYSKTADYAAAVYNQKDTVWTICDQAGNPITCESTDFVITYRLTTEGDFGATPPSTVGEYMVCIHYNATSDYNASAEDLVLSLSVVRGTVYLSWKPYDAEMAYGTKFALDDKYEVGSEEARQYIEYVHEHDEVQDEIRFALHYTYSADEGATWQSYTVTSAAPIPGLYRVTADMECALYVGTTRVPAAIRVHKVVLRKEDLDLSETSVVYGEPVSVRPRAEGKIITGQWQVSFGQRGVYGVSAVSSGSYDVHLTLEDDPMYSADLQYLGLLTIRPRTVHLTVWDYDVVYGDRAFTQGVTYGNDRLSGMVCWRPDEVLEEDKTAFLATLSMTVTSPSGANVAEIDSNFVVTTEGYPMQVACSSDDYVIEIDRQGLLLVLPRPLRVSITSTTGSMTVYEGATPRLVLNIDNWVLDAEYEDLRNALSYTYVDVEGNAVEGTPTAPGSYTLKLTYEDVPVLSNYDVRYTTAKLTIKSLSLPTTAADFAVTGHFDSNEELVVTKVANSVYSSEASKVLKGYDVVAAYEISHPRNAANGQITFRLAMPEGVRDPVVLYLEGNQWTQVEATVEDGMLVFSQSAMASKYLICAKGEINWLLIGLIAGGVVLIAVGVVVALGVVRMRHNKHLASEASKQVAAPTAAATGKPNEEEELDDFIDTFDESTVERELTPAERIALREKEEKYQQYKARLERMRTSDRTLRDTLTALGISDSDDDDAIIARMIEADEERARQVEEEVRREEEAQRAAEEEATRAVILERSDDVLEQKTFAPTIVDTDDDDDIDI